MVDAIAGESNDEADEEIEVSAGVTAAKRRGSVVEVPSITYD